jgi:hypothetical protein
MGGYVTYWFVYVAQYCIAVYMVEPSSFVTLPSKITALPSLCSHQLRHNQIQRIKFEVASSYWGMAMSGRGTEEGTKLSALRYKFFGYLHKILWII